MSVAFSTERSTRTEVDVAADTICALLSDGLVPVTPESIVRCARATGVPVDAIKRAWYRHQRGYTPSPRPVELLDQHAEAVKATVHSLNREAVRRANPIPGIKRCARCGELKPYDDFAKASVKSKGLRHSFCRPCSADYARERRARGRELGLLQAIRAHLAADSPFVGDECPVCGVALAAGDEVTAHDVIVGHAACIEEVPDAS